MAMMMSQQRLLAATALSTVTASTVPPTAARPIVTAVGQHAVFKDVEASEIALSSPTYPERTIDMWDGRLYYLTAVRTDATDDRHCSTFATTSQRSVGSSIQRKKGFDNVFARRRGMNSDQMNSRWAALVRLHPAA